MKQEEKDRIVYLYKKLGTYDAVQQETGRSLGTIWRIVKEAGANVGKGGNQKSQQKFTDEELLADISSGLTRQEIADKRNVHVTNVDRRMRKLGVHAEYAKVYPTVRVGYAECWHFVPGHYELVNRKHPEYEYLETQNKATTKRIRIKCRKCGTLIERAESTVREKGIKCDYCEQEDKLINELLNERIHLMRFFDALIEKQTPKKCHCCDKIYYSEYKNKEYCSERCKRKAKRERYKERDPERYMASKRKGARCSHYIHRTKKYGCKFEYGITLKKVIERDNNICQLCHKPCDTNDKAGGLVGDMYPSIDHIRPLSKGGSHTWDNVQLAHKICNSYKRDLYTA